MNAKCLAKYTVSSRQQISVHSLLPMHVNVLMSRQISHRTREPNFSPISLRDLH